MSQSSQPNSTAKTMEMCIRDMVGITALIPIVGAWVGLIVGAFMIGMESLTLSLIHIFPTCACGRLRFGKYIRRMSRPHKRL